jgi:hypothetical protein
MSTSSQQMVLGSLSINPGYLVVGAGSFHSTLSFSLAVKGLIPLYCMSQSIYQHSLKGFNISHIMLCSPLKVNLHFRGICHLHLQGRHIPPEIVPRAISPFRILSLRSSESTGSSRNCSFLLFLYISYQHPVDPIINQNPMSRH